MYKFENEIYVTKPLTPELDTFYSHTSAVFESSILTNMGPKHNLLSDKLCDYLSVENLSLFCNGTIALMTALRALNLPKGSEIITTPFTFSATPHVIEWNGQVPVFVDIIEKQFTICPKAIEAAITEKTSAILAVHVYGFPCKVEEIEAIARKHNLRVIYDGAHAFNTRYKNRSICMYGDITMLSFHATKLFNTVEGGALIYNDRGLQQKIEDLRNFGFRSEESIQDIGLNGKMNEIQASVGLSNISLVQEECDKRKRVKELYVDLLDENDEIFIPKFSGEATDSMQYFPIFICGKRDLVYNSLRDFNVYARKYFYPLCSDFEVYKNNPKGCLDNAKLASDSVLCLPLYGDLTEEHIHNICEIILYSLRES